jgi:hypothetical protein
VSLLETYAVVAQEFLMTNNFWQKKS